MSDTTTSLINGSYLCGAARLLLQGPAFTVMFHCNSGRKFTGSAIGANSLVNKKNPESAISAYGAQTAESCSSSACYSCSFGGFSLFVANEKDFPSQIAVTSGTMDDMQVVEGADSVKLWKPDTELLCKRK